MIRINKKNNIEEELQQKLREWILINDSFKNEQDKEVFYTIESNKGIKFNNEFDNCHNCGFLKNKNNINIFYQIWTTNINNPTIFFSTGNAENSSTHPKFIYSMLNQGYNFVTYDQEGFGDSDGIRGVLEDFDTYVANLNIVLQFFIEEYSPQLSSIIFSGFSTGALVNLYYYIFYEKLFGNQKNTLEYINKIILMSPFLGPHKRVVSPILKNTLLLFRPLLSKDKIIRQDSQLLLLNSQNDTYVSFYKNLTDNINFLYKRKKDTRIHRLNSFRWLSEIFWGQNSIKRRIKKENKNQKLNKNNFFIFISENDLVVNNNIPKNIMNQLGLSENLITQKNFYHDFLDYEDDRWQSFFDKFINIIR